MLSFTSGFSIVWLLLLSATIFNRSLCGRNAGTHCSGKDQWALLKFKEGAIDPSNKLSSWSSQEDCCTWTGVQCDKISGRVTQLDLHCEDDCPSPNCLQDDKSLVTPPHLLANSSNLLYLDLSGNENLQIYNLQFLSRLSSLKYLDLSGIDLQNETNWLQSIAMLPSLSELYLRDCQLANISPSLDYVNFSTSLVTLDFSENYLGSKFPIWLCYLASDISYLDLSLSNLRGLLPKAFSNLKGLQYLDLSGNQLNGSIPEWLGQFEHLQHLDLSNNSFYGSIPSSLGQLSNLEYLSVSGNSLDGVLSETNFAKLSNLKELNLGSGFKFELDPKWIPPFQLSHIDLSYSLLGPNFPEWLYTQGSLQYIDISSSGISSLDGSRFWSFVARTEAVDLSKNSMSGDLSNVTLNTTYIDISYNNFTGGLPHVSSMVQQLDLSHNSFSGPISPLLCHASGGNSLGFLDISYNLMTGPLTDCWDNWQDLYTLYMGSNMLTGEVPSSMGSLSQLTQLDLHNNSLFGEFSLDLTNWKNLGFLNLENNKFSGSLPNGMQQSIEVIKLRSNQFSGNIPPQLCSLASLTVLDLAHNHLSGSIPPCVCNITAMASNVSITQLLYRFDDFKLSTKGQEREYFPHNLVQVRTIDFSANNLSGEIPRELFTLIRLQSLNLSRNHLTGNIPANIGGMKELESLDLSNNKLSGEIPPSISNLSFLDCLDISYNRLTGQIPLGTQLQSFDESRYAGNPGLCGPPLTKNCTEKITNNTRGTRGKEDESMTESLYLGMAVGFAVGFWGVCGTLCLNRAFRHTYFRLVDGVIDRLYVAVALKVKSFLVKGTRHS